MQQVSGTVEVSNLNDGAFSQTVVLLDGNVFLDPSNRNWESEPCHAFSQTLPASPADYRRVERAIRFLAEDFRNQPSLDAVAQRVGLSPFHFQRLFTRWAGVSPKRFVQYLTADYAKALLQPLLGDSSPSVQEAVAAALTEADFAIDPLSAEYRVQ